MTFPYHNQDCYNYCGPACVDMVLSFLCHKKGVDLSAQFSTVPPELSQAKLLPHCGTILDQQSPTNTNPVWYAAPDGICDLLNAFLEYFGITSVRYEIYETCAGETEQSFIEGRNRLLAAMTNAILKCGAPAMVPILDRSHWVVASALTKVGLEYEWRFTDPWNSSAADGCRTGPSLHTSDETCALCKEYPYSLAWQNEVALRDDLFPVSLGVKWKGKFIAILPKETAENYGEFDRLEPTTSGQVPSDFWSDLAPLPSHTKARFPKSAPGKSFFVQMLGQPSGNGYFLRQVLQATPAAPGTGGVIGMARVHSEGGVFGALPIKNHAEARSQILTEEMSDQSVISFIQSAADSIPQLPHAKGVPAGEIHLEPGYFWKPCTQTALPYNPFRIAAVNGTRCYVFSSGAVFISLDDSKLGM